MKKFTFVILIFILVISIFFISIQKVQQEYSAATVMNTAFKTTGASAVSCEVFIHCDLTSANFEKEDTRRQLLCDIISGAGGDPAGKEPLFSSIDNDMSFGTQTDYIINDDRTIHTSVLKDRQAKTTDLFSITATYDDTSGSADMAGAVDGLDNVFAKYVDDPAVNISITGSLDGKLEEGDLDRLYKKVFKTIGADEVEGIDEAGLISVSAFSPSIRDSVRVNGKRININMAARYNSYEGKTYIWLATPVITTEY